MAAIRSISMKVSAKRAFSTTATTLSGARGIGLSAFRDALADTRLPEHGVAVNTVTAASSPLPFALVTRALGSVVGVEGSKVFPTLMGESTWKPSSEILARVQRILTDKKRISASHPVEDIVGAIREDSKVGVHGMLKQKNVPSFAGWRCSDKQWLQYQGVADLCFFGLADAKGREDVSRFTDVGVSPLSSQELQSLGVPNPQQSVVFRTPTPVHYHSLAVFDSAAHSHLSNDDLDSHALLYATSALLNQAFLHDFDEPKIAYSMIRTERTFRFVAFQLNNLMVPQQQNHQRVVANATWVYESELFHGNKESGEVLVNPEPLLIMHNILQGVCA